MSWRTYGPCRGSRILTLPGLRAKTRAQFNQIIGGKTWSLCIITGIAESHAALLNSGDELRRQIDDLSAEIARHHRDFERWEAMADRAVRSKIEMRVALGRALDILDSLRPYSARVWPERLDKEIGELRGML